MGISAAGMYGQLTTGKPMHIISRIAGETRATELYVSIDTRRNLSLLFISSGHQRIRRRRLRRSFRREGGKMFPETAFKFVFLPSVRLWVRQEVLPSPWRSSWHLQRYTRTLKRNPAVFRRRAARTDDGARRPVETPRSFSRRRADPRRRCHHRDGAGRDDRRWRAIPLAWALLRYERIYQRSQAIRCQARWRASHRARRTHSTARAAAGR
jgi:hypothetical protein